MRLRLTVPQRRLLRAVAWPAVAVALVCGLLADPSTRSWATGATAHPVAHTCTAAIVPFEDGSWATGAMLYDDVVVDAHWAWRMPTYGWAPAYKGTPCTIVLAGVR